MHAQPTCHLPFMDVSEAAFKPWIKGDLTSAEVILSEEIASSMGPSHHALANRALVRAWLKQWPKSIEDSKKVPSRFLFFFSSLFIHCIHTSPSQFDRQPLVTLRMLSHSWDKGQKWTHFLHSTSPLKETIQIRLHSSR